MTKFGKGLNREIVEAVNSGEISEPFSTSDVRRLVQSKHWNPEPSELYINATLSNAASGTYSTTSKKYFETVGDGKYIVRQQYKDIISLREIKQDEVSSHSLLEKTFPNPSHEDYFNFLLRLYFGDSQDYLGCCIQRAYHDFNRTLHGIANHPDSKKLQKNASRILRSELLTLRELTSIENQEAFDNWHERLCKRLCSSYADSFFKTFRIGQAQKWVNMTLKYTFTFGEEHLSGFKKYYPYGHVPIDNIILDKLRPYRVPRLPCAWSRIDSYEVYMGFQRWIRNAFPSSVPLAVEFHLWQQTASHPN